MYNVSESEIKTFMCFSKKVKISENNDELGLKFIKKCCFVTILEMI